MSDELQKRGDENKPDDRMDPRVSSNSPKDDNQDDCCRQCQEYLEGWKRAQADYANLKKDMDRLRFEVSGLAKEQLLHEFLPAIDQFEAALDHLPDLEAMTKEDGQKMVNWLVGIKAVKQLWEQAFKTIGLENVDTAGVFDPNKHNAVGKEEDTSQPPEAILKVVQPGWMINGRVIRPAKVIVNLFNN